MQLSLRTSALLLMLTFTSACSSTSKNFDEVPRSPASHPLDPHYIAGPLNPTTSLSTIRRNLSRGTGMIFGLRFLFESDAFLRLTANAAAQNEAQKRSLPLDEAEKLRLFLLTKAADKAASSTCFIFENDATDKEELDPSNYDLKLQTLDGKVSHPLELRLDPGLDERLKKERLPFTIRGEACTPNTLPYDQGFRISYLRKDKMMEAKERAESKEGAAVEPVKPKLFEWLPWQEGVSQDLHRSTW